jgi:hypothetical protein
MIITRFGIEKLMAEKPDMNKNPIILLLSILITVGVSQENTNVIPLTDVGIKSHVTVRVGDVTIPEILLDTGFAFDGLLIYNADYRDSLDLTRGMEVKIGGAGSGEASTAFMLDSVEFSLGDIIMSNQKLLVLKGDQFKGFPSNGIIGYSIFGHYITELNYDNNTMILHNRDEFEIDQSWTVIPMYFKNNKIPWIDAAVVISEEKPVPISTYIDYAAGESVLLLERPDMKFQLPDSLIDVHLGRGLSGDIYGRTGYISKLIIGPYELENVKASFADAKVRSKQENADGILGIGSLRRFNLIFDYFNKKLYLKPNSRFAEPFGP